MKVVVVSWDHVGTRMAGPAIRAYRLARELAKRFDVTLVVPFETDLADDSLPVLVARRDDARRLTAIASRFDAVVAQQLPVPTMTALSRAGVRVVYDLYAPLSVENLAIDARKEPSRYLELAYRLTVLTERTCLLTGSGFVCANETQRDLWLGQLAALGRVDRARYDEDSSLRALVDVVPFGLDREPPRPAPEPVLKGRVPGIRPSDRVLLWGSGVWNWFDPLTVIRAVGELSQRRDDVRLYFIGLRHPNPEVEEMAMTRRAVALAEELGLRDRVVFFNFDWIPYAERGSYLAEADVGVSAHFDDLETRYAFRMRLVDYLWAGLPILTSRGDSLGELVEVRELGRALAPEDVAGWVAAIDELLADRAAYERARANVLEAREDFAWPVVAQPLAELVARSGAAVAPAVRLRAAEAEYVSLRLRLALLRHGARGAAGRLVGRARARGPKLG